MQLVNKISDLQPFEIITNLDDKFIVIDTSGTYTVEVRNIRTGEDETIEGDYLKNGELSNVYTRGDVDEYLESLDPRAEQYKQKVRDMVNDIDKFYFS